MRAPAIIVIILTAIGLAGPACARAAPTVLVDAQPDQRPPEASPEDYRRDIRSLTEKVIEHWSYLEHRRELSGVDPARLEAEALSALAGEPDAEDFHRALRRYAAGLHDGHSGVLWAGAPPLGTRRLPFNLAECEEGVILSGVGETAAGVLRAGDVVRSIDDQPIERVLADAEAETCASTPGARRRSALLMLPLNVRSERVVIEVERPETGEIIRAECACPRSDAPVPGLILPLWRRQVSMPEPGIGYFRPGSFSPPKDSGWSDASPEERERILEESYRELGRVFDELAGMRVLILDLRGNGGGTDLLGQELAGLLLDRSSVYFRLQGRRADGNWARTHAYRVRRARGREPFGGPVVCLIDEGTFSTADNLAACLRDEHPDITFVGAPTGAGTGAPRPFTLDRTGAVVWFCTQRVFSPSGGLIEGVGVTPDVPVGRSRRDILDGRDTALDRAIEIARSRLDGAGG